MRLTKSKLVSYLTCPFKYGLAYELGVRPKKMALELALGRAVHNMITKGFLTQKDEGELAEEAWEGLSPDTVDASEAEIAEAKSQSIRLKKAFHEAVEISPIKVEYELVTPVQHPITLEVLPVDLSGRMDLVDEADGVTRVIEIKTKARSGNGSSKLSQELTFYAYQLFMEGVDELTVAYLDIIKGKTPKVQLDQSPRTQKDFVEFFYLVKAVSEGIQKGYMFKNPGVHCSWCDFRPVCVEDREAVLSRFDEESIEALVREGLI